MPRHHWKRARPAALPALLLVGALPGCGIGDPADDLPSDSAYVEVMARLSLVHAQVVNRDPRAADSARQAILERYGIETAALQRYAQRHGDDPAHMKVIWEAISDLTLALDSAANAEAETPDAPGTPAAAQTDEGGTP